MNNRGQRNNNNMNYESSGHDKGAGKSRGDRWHNYAADCEVIRIGPFTEGVPMAAQKICRTMGVGRFPQAWS